MAEPDNAIVIVSYQAEKTLGRKIAEGIEKIQIMDQWFELNAAVYVLDGFSGHADRNDLARGGTARPAARSARRSSSTVSPRASKPSSRCSNRTSRPTSSSPRRLESYEV